MVSSLIICGSHSFPREEDEEYDDERTVRSAGSSPRRSASRSKPNTKNLYSDRGLDKFFALLAEIEEKREKIYSEISPDEISFVQFDYSKGNKGKPIVVKAKVDQTHMKKKKMKKQQEKHVILRCHASDPLDHHDHNNNNNITTHSQPLEDLHPPMERSRSEVGPGNRVHERRLKLNRPKYYLPVVLMVILLFLALFGRSVAIMCTSIGWYLIPTISNGDCSLRRRSFKKKGLVGPQGGVGSFKGLSHGNNSSSSPA